MQHQQYCVLCRNFSLPCDVILSTTLHFAVRRRSECCSVHAISRKPTLTACLQSERGPSRSPVPTSGTVCRRMWSPLHHCRCSDNDSFVPPHLSEHNYVLFELCFPSLTVVLAVFFILRPLAWNINALCLKIMQSMATFAQVRST